MKMTLLLLLSIYLPFSSLLAQQKLDWNTLFDQITNEPQKIVFTNTHDVNNEDGHIQGIQQFVFNGKEYFFMTGSSSDYSYYSIADLERKEIIAVNTWLGNPFRHAGGFQIVDDLLAVGIEDNKKADQSKVLIYKIINPTKPKLKLLKTINRQGEFRRYTSGCVAMVKHKGNIVLAIGNWDTVNLDFYRIAEDKLERKDSKFQEIGSIAVNDLKTINWIEKNWYPYQNINFVKDAHEQIYLVGFAFDKSQGQEVVDVFSYDFNNLKLAKVASKRIAQIENMSFLWAGGIQFNLPNEIKLLMTERNIDKQFQINVFE